MLEIGKELTEISLIYVVSAEQMCQMGYPNQGIDLRMIKGSG